VIGYLDEIESDLSRFHRVADPMGMDSPRFFRLARLLASYDGALAHAIRRDHPELTASPTQQAAPSASQIPTYSGATLAAMTSGPGDDHFPGIEWDGD